MGFSVFFLQSFFLSNLIFPKMKLGRYYYFHFRLVCTDSEEEICPRSKIAMNGV